MTITDSNITINTNHLIGGEFSWIRLTLKNKKEVLLLIAKEGESLRGFSKKIGVSCAYVSQIINGKRNPSSNNCKQDIKRIERKY